jgi:hypothetical protein
MSEVKSIDHLRLLMSFVGVLRVQYSERTIAPTCCRALLAGVHDVNHLNVTLRPGSAGVTCDFFSISAA